MSGFLEATQLFRLSSLSAFSLRTWKCSHHRCYVITALSSAVVFLHYDCTKHRGLRPSPSFEIFFSPHFFLKDDISPPAFQFLTWRDYASPLDVFSLLDAANDSTLLWQTDISSTITVGVFPHGLNLSSETLLPASFGGLNNLLPAKR